MPMITPIVTKARSGRRTVTYRDANGKTMNGTVLGAGTNSGIKIEVFNRGRRLVIDDVPKATTMKSTGAYFNMLNK